MTVSRLRALRNAAADEIDAASMAGDRDLMAALVKARDALNDALVAAGDQEAAESARDHCSLDEMNKARGVRGKRI